jgi:hypothetical protein
VLALVVDAVADPLSIVADEAVVVVGSAVTPVTVWTVPSGAVYTPVMALPLPPTSSWYTPGKEVRFGLARVVRTTNEV